MPRACDQMRQGPVTQPGDRDNIPFHSYRPRKHRGGWYLGEDGAREGWGEGVGGVAAFPVTTWGRVSGQTGKLPGKLQSLAQGPCCLPGVTPARKGLLENPPGAASG